MTDDRQGFEIRGTFYPWVEEMNVMDPVLVQRVTGLPYRQFVETWQEAIAAAEDDDDTSGDPIVMNGLIAVAIWRQHPLWTVDKVLRFLQGVSQGELEFTGEDEDEDDEQDGQSPPSIAPSDGGSDSTPSGSFTPNVSTSNGQAESHLAPTPVRSGEPESVTGSPV